VRVNAGVRNIAVILTTIQIAILIVLPLLLFYRRVNLRIPQIITLGASSLTLGGLGENIPYRLRVKKNISPIKMGNY
jgi:hypothetical protein